MDGVDEWYLCGPFGMVTGAEALLKDRGVDVHHIHHEIFHVDEAGDTVRRPRPTASTPPAATGGHVTVTLDGRTTEVPMPSLDESILDATPRVRRTRRRSPVRTGFAAPSRAHLVSGEVRMDRELRLEPDEIEAGVVLASSRTPSPRRSPSTTTPEWLMGGGPARVDNPPSEGTTFD